MSKIIDYPSIDNESLDDAIKNLIDIKNKYKNSYENLMLVIEGTYEPGGEVILLGDKIKGKDRDR